MNIDRDAPVMARGEAVISAPPGTVFATLADIDSWSAWNPDVAPASIDGPLAVGSGFRWRAGGAPISSTLASVEEPAELGWAGTSLGLRAVHVWRFEEQAGGTRVFTEESMSGLPARLLRGRVQAMVERSPAAGLAALKDEAERRGESSPSG